MRWWLFKRNVEQSLPPEKPPAKRDLKTLVANYKLNQYVGSVFKLEGRQDLLQSALDGLRQIEKEIIEILPPGPQKEVVKILVRYRLDILPFLEDDWKEPFKSVCQEMTYWLGQSLERWNLPFAPKELLFWLIQQTRSGSEERQVNAIKAFIAGNVCGHQLDEEKIRNTSNMVITVVAGNTTFHQFRVLADVYCEVAGGEELIKEVIFGEGAPTL